MTVFTICSNNYLAQAKVLGNSLNQSNPDYQFIIFLCDEINITVDYKEIDHKIIKISDVEPSINELAKKYNIIELNTAVKPCVIEYLFNDLQINKIIYLDPDIYVYESLKDLELELETNSILLTPHIISPITLDGKSPGENTFLNFGIYNLGFIALKNDINGKKLVQWWKNITYNLGYNRVNVGLFVDQLPMNLAPLFFDNVKIVKNLGYNMAPWNLHERYLSEKNKELLVNGKEKLFFFHFSNFRIDSDELPIHNYNRFTLSSRPDLRKIYSDYNQRLNEAGFKKYFIVISVYSELYCQERIKQEKIAFHKSSIREKITIILKKNLLSNIKKVIKRFFK